jgi:hypothetical protein
MSLQADLSGQITSPSRTSPFYKPRYLSLVKVIQNDIGINHIKNASIPSNNIEIIHKPVCLMPSDKRTCVQLYGDINKRLHATELCIGGIRVNWSIEFE